VRFLYLLSICAGAVAIAIFAAQNRTPISLKFFALQSVELPLGLVAVAACCCGLLSVGFMGLLLQWGKPRLSPAAQELQGRLARLENP
jgi:uncharacterized integral membrane protein